YGTLMGILAVVLFPFPVEPRLWSTCVVCRLNRAEFNHLGICWSRSEESKCSRGYAVDVEPSHSHVWERSTCRRLLNLWGGPGPREPLLVSALSGFGAQAIGEAP